MKYVIDIKEDISAFQLRELIKLLAKVLNIKINEKDIPKGLIKHFKEVKK